MRSVFSPARALRGILALILSAVLPLAAVAQQSQSPSQGRHGAPHKQPAGKPADASTRASAQTPAVAPPEQFGDGIAAVVNKDIITLREVNEGVKTATQELTRQNIQLPDPKVLQRQVLQRLIMQTLERQEAARMNIKVDDAQVDQAIASVAARNRMSTDQLRQAVEKEGLTWAGYRKNIRGEILSDRLRQRAVESNLVVSDSEVDAFLKEQQRRQGAFGAGPVGGPSSSGNDSSAPVASAAPAAQVPAGPQLISLAQILVRVPENASREQVDTLRRKAEDILARLKSGGDFASIAAAASDGPEALEGGVMGERPLEGWPDLFVNAIAHLGKGQISGIIQSGNGFHILKVLDRRSAGSPAPARNPVQTPPARAPETPPPGPGSDGAMRLPQGPMEVTQTHARHILIKTSAVMSDDEARQRLELLRQRIVEGHEDFGALARQNSQDVTAPQGGDLGWLNPGETVPEFEQAMNSLKVGEVSQPVHTRFGWHLIQVLGRRQKDVKDEVERMQARRILFERRAELAFDDYLEQLRDQAYIDNRLEKQQNQQNNNQ